MTHYIMKRRDKLCWELKCANRMYHTQGNHGDIKKALHQRDKGDLHFLAGVPSIFYGNICIDILFRKKVGIG